MEGSTVVQGSISAESRATAEQLANSLYDSVKANRNLLGYPVTYMSVGAYFDDTKVYDASIYRDVPTAIIGCAIALAVMLLGALLLACLLIKSDPKADARKEGKKNTRK